MSGENLLRKNEECYIFCYDVCKKSLQFIFFISFASIINSDITLLTMFVEVKLMECEK
jgi:hypothetical protein